MIGYAIPEDDDMWQCFLLLLDILKVSTCRIQSPGLAGYLKSLLVIIIIHLFAVIQDIVLPQSSTTVSTYLLKLSGNLCVYGQACMKHLEVM